jgi:hypothetical protein
VQAGPAWHSNLGQWKNNYANLPVYGGRQIILVPKLAARYHLGVDHHEYYSQFVLEYLHQENLNSNSSLVQVLKNGKRRVTKKSLEELYPCSKDFLREFSEKHPEVFKEYKRYVSGKKGALSDVELEAILRRKLELRPGGDPPDEETGDGEDEQGADGDAGLTGREVAHERHEQQRPQDAVDRLDGDDDEPGGEGPGKGHRRHPTALAMPNAAAASPPTTAVCQALRSGLAVVNRPLT